MASSAERQRRSRAHRSGDHSLCIPGRCGQVTPDVTPDVTPCDRDKPQLGEAGSQLWRDMTAEGLGPMQMVLLLEACRIADRLDRLDAHLEGDRAEWLNLEVDNDGNTATVIVDKALSEARQQATALKQLVAEIRQSGAKSGKKQEPQRKGAGGVADLSARIAARRSSSAG